MESYERLKKQKRKISPIQVRANEGFKERIQRGADSKGIATMSDYIRMAIIEKLERDGVE
jgi:hypothetical protein